MVTSEVCQVPGCGRPVKDACLCADCVTQLAGALTDVPALSAALEAAYLRQQRFSVTPTGLPDPEESPVPFNSRAGRIRRELARELVRWTLQVQYVHGDPWVPVRQGAKGDTA